MAIQSNQELYDHMRYFHGLSDFEIADQLETNLGVYADAHDDLHLVAVGHTHFAPDNNVVLLTYDLDNAEEVAPDGLGYYLVASTIDTYASVGTELANGEKITFLKDKDGNFKGEFVFAGGLVVRKGATYIDTIKHTVGAKMLVDHDITNLTPTTADTVIPVDFNAVDPIIIL